MVVTCSGKNFVAATQHVLPHYLCRYVRVAGLGQVAVCCFANEAAFTLWIEPAGCLTIGNDRGEWRALILLTARTALLLLLATAATTTTTTAALSAASALIASTTSVVTVIAIAMLTAPALVALLLSLATTAAALRLRIVLGLLL
jgi:hypothetical protein